MPLKIQIYPDKELKAPCFDVVFPLGVATKTFISELKEKCMELKAFGLAAPQVGYGIRVVIWKGEWYQTLINPEIVWMSLDRQPVEEACLSLPWIRSKVMRSMMVKVKGRDIAGNEVLIPAYGLEAQILQHEVDHLNGILFIDRLSPIKRGFLRTKLKRIIRARKRLAKR